MILLDLQPVMISNLVANAGRNDGVEFDEDLLRHMILNSIRGYLTQFKREYGELVVACDEGSTWRHQRFKYYKENRKRGREDSKLDWNVVFTTFRKVKKELKENFPYKVIEVPLAEADDIIATLAREAESRTLIISRDHDFLQLLRGSFVVQWDPITKKTIEVMSQGNLDTLMGIETSRPDVLREHIIRGDVGDGIPNVLSDDDCLVARKRQTVLSSKRFDRLMAEGPSNWSEQRNWDRNEELIDLSRTPKEIKEAIIREYHLEGEKQVPDLYDYFVSKGLRNLMESISDF